MMGMRRSSMDPSVVIRSIVGYVFREFLSRLGDDPSAIRGVDRVVQPTIKPCIVWSAKRCPVPNDVCPA